ncbi:VOC family protein [Roseiconus nitratireducens]|uniref:VOC family protein n=1 Tax=Roseiconus nitratireducens TaxID=2605748 RepID=A0A5M6CW54_9BACT|nr:VOC family protein [Roseiconus nitratireducens]KAA5539458.1 VOC family protein [Roseiconus nitratireducens]
MKENPVGWFELYVKDLDRAKRFYEAVFETQLQKLDSPTPELEMLAFPMSTESVGAPGALVKANGPSPGGFGTLVYFSCEDCEVEAGRVEAAGGKVDRPKMSIGQYGFIALVTDTEGNMIGLHSRS